MNMEVKNLQGDDGAIVTVAFCGLKKLPLLGQDVRLGTRAAQRPLSEQLISTVFTHSDLTKPMAKLVEGVWREARIVQVNPERLPFRRFIEKICKSGYVI